MQLTAYHAKYVAHDLTKQAPPGAEDQLSMSLFDTSVDIKPASDRSRNVRPAIAAVRMHNPIDKHIKFTLRKQVPLSRNKR